MLGYDRLHPAWMHHALVLSDDLCFYYNVLFALNDPSLHGDIVYAFAPDPRHFGGLTSAYPHRTLYWISVAHDTIQFRRAR